MHLLSFIQDYTGLIEPAMSYYSINIPKGGQRGGLIMTVTKTGLKVPTWHFKSTS